MKKYFLFLAVALFFISCGEKEEATADKSDVVAKNVAHINIEGMMCAEACGGKIKKELAAMDCVKDVSIEFNSDNPVDMAVVQYDGEACSDQDMKVLIEGLVDGAYKVKSIEVTDI